MREEDKNRQDEGRGDGGPASNDAPLPAAATVVGDGGLIVVSAGEIAAIGTEPVVGSSGVGAGSGVGGGGGGSNERGRPLIELKIWQVAAIVVLVAFTIFITWRVKRLEKSVLVADFGFGDDFEERAGVYVAGAEWRYGFAGGLSRQENRGGELLG